MKKIFISLTVIIVLGLLFVVSEFGHINEIKQWKSPDEKYALAVIERRSYLDLFGQHVQHMIIIGQNGAVPDYGHPKDYSFIHGHPDYNAYISRCIVEWDSSGATFQEPEGHKLFFPKKVYEGGR